MSEKNNDKNKFSALKGLHRVVPIILTFGALLLAVLLIWGGGAFGGGIRSLLMGLFGFGAYVIPAALLIHGLCYPEDLEHKSIRRRAVFSAVTTLIVACIDYALSISDLFPAVFAPAEAFINMSNGGAIGNVFGYILSYSFGKIGAIIVCVAIFAIYATFFYAEKAGSLGQAALRIKGGVKNAVSGIKQKSDAAKEKKRQIKAEEDRQRYEAASEELMSDDFFTSKGNTSGVKVKKLGIDEESSPSGASSLIHPSKRHYEAGPEVIPTEDKPERRRRSADKPLDTSYGMDSASAFSTKSEKKESFDNAFFGIDDSADNVFTRDFDPFDFATGEKTAAKYANKVSTVKAGIEEELDEFTIYEMKANHIPSEREKRLMELERRKQEWLYQKRQREQKAMGNSAPKADEPVKVDTVSLFDSVIDPAVKKTPAYATSAAAFGAAFDRPRDIPTPPPAPTPMATPVATPVAEPVAEPVTTPTTTVSAEEPIKEQTIPTTAVNSPVAEQTVPTSVNAYTSYSTTKTTYHQPIKTVEFTITKDPKPEPKPVQPQKPVAVAEETSEDVAIRIAERIARQTPGYQRSANDLKTYTKVVTSPEDEELFRQLNGSTQPVASQPVVSQPAPTEAKAEPAPTLMTESETVELAPVEEPKLPETVEFSFGEKQEAVTAEVSSEVQLDPTPFKPYEAPTAPIFSVEEQRKEETLKVERTMLSPTPESISPSEPEAAAPSQPEAVEFEPLFETVEIDETPSAEERASIPEADFVEAPLPDEDDEDEDDEDEDETIASEMPEEENVTTEEIPPEKQNPEVLKMREMFPFLTPIDEQKPVANEEKAEPAVAEPVAVETAPEEDIDDVPFDEPTVVKEAPAPKATAIVPTEEKKEEKKKPDYSDYQFPDINLLAKEESLYDENIQIETQENADKLIETLASFGVTASIKGVDRGPRITRYEVVPAKGVKVSQILNLQDDIALNLAAGDIRMEAPIPGKSAVGVEIPNKKSSIVRLRDLLETAEFKYSKSKTLSCIGRDIAGQPVFGDLASMPHLLIAGATGMGKSVCINSLLISILYKARPDEVKFIMIDPKQVEFTMYNGIPHLLVPVVSDPKQAAGALMWAVEEMERRFDALRPLCVRNIDAYNEKVTADPSLGSPMSKIIIVIDEFADLMLQVKDPVEALVMRIAQKARAAGIHLVIGTQRPSVNVITGVIKANVPSRISCKVMSNVDSKTILDMGGAEKLLDKGDSLYAPSGSPKPHRVQCAFVSDSEVESIMNFLKQYGNGENYDSDVMADIERAAQKCSKKGDRGDRDDDDGSDGSGEGYLNDRQFLDAVEIAVNTRKISTSLIQRKLSIGYGKAAKFIDIMEDMGIVGEANGQRPREVLLTPDEWREKLARASLD